MKLFLFYFIIRHTFCFQSWVTLLQPTYFNFHVSSIVSSKRFQYCKMYCYCFQCFFFQNFLSQCGNIKKNPGHKCSSLRFCPCNLNGLTAHDYIEITLIQGCITDQNFDIVCLPETFLNSSIQNDDRKLKIDDYNLIRFDHPCDSKMVEFVFNIKNIFLLLRVTTFAL